MITTVPVWLLWTNKWWQKSYKKILKKEREAILLSKIKKRFIVCPFCFWHLKFHNKLFFVRILHNVNVYKDLYLIFSFSACFKKNKKNKNSLDFCPASLKSLGCFYFRCILSSQWKVVTVNFTQPTLKAFLEAHSQNVSGNKQYLVAHATECPKPHFSTLMLFWSAKKLCKDTFPPSITFPM